MSYRFMRVMLLFDLPVVTNEDLRTYRQFRRFLLKSGFIMMQESVYTKLALNSTVANSIMEAVRKSKPKKGLVQMLLITEKQFSRMEFVVGFGQTEYIDSDERLIEL